VNLKMAHSSLSVPRPRKLPIRIQVSIFILFVQVVIDNKLEFIILGKVVPNEYQNQMLNVAFYFVDYSLPASFQNATLLHIVTV